MCKFSLLLVKYLLYLPFDFFTSITDLHFWNGASPKSELAYLRKFEGLLDVIMDDTELIWLDGESVCVSTRDSLRSIMEDELTEFERRNDDC